MKKILITGGAGYVGSLLTLNLSKLGHKVIIYDTCYFGTEHIKENENLKLIKADIRDKSKFESAVEDCDTVIHLACISNDPSYALNETLSKTINYDCFEDLVKIFLDEKKIYESSDREFLNLFFNIWLRYDSQNP